LRFPEFSGEWIHCALGDISEVTKLAGFEFTQYVTYEDSGSIIALRGLNCKNGRLDLSDVKYIDNSNLSKLTRSKLYIGDILFTYVGTVGEVAIIEENDRYYLAPNVSRIRLNNGYNPYFVKQLLHTNRFYNKIILPLIATSSQPALSMENVRKFALQIPSISEQHKISSFLTLLDKRIATQIKIIEDLKKLKSAISNKLFSRKDLLETSISLSEIATLKNGYAFQSSTYNPAGHYKIITIANVSGARYIDTNSCNSIINIPNDIQEHQILGEGDILISLTGNVGRVSLCLAGNYLLNQRVGLLQLALDVDREYVYQALSCKRFEQAMIACGQGAAQMNIGKGDIENYRIPYSFNQHNLKLIAATLNACDDIISVETSKLTSLQLQKQYLLAQMFI